MEACLRSFYGGWIFELQWGPSMVIFSHGVVVEDKRRRSEKRHHPLGNKPWKKKLHHQESVLDKKLKEEASMEEENEREREREKVAWE